MTCNSSKPLQAKLSIGASDDPLEHEADRVAGQVLAAPAPAAIGGAPMRIQRFTGRPRSETSTAPDSVDRVLAGSGRPLEPTLQQDMEQRFGHDFSQVRVHSDGAAGQSARDVNANAYTVGHDIVFGEGRFAPETHEGQRLLAHELTHVVQQSKVIRPYRNKKAFNFGKNDDASLIEDSFNIAKDKETKPWIQLVTVEFTSKTPDADGIPYWQGMATVQYYDNAAKFSDFSFAISGGSAAPGKTDKGIFTVSRIEGVGYNSGSFSGVEGVDYKSSEREGPRKKYSKDLLGNMNFAVFYNKGEALHAGPLTDSSHGCVHVDWTDEKNIKQLNYHSVIGLTKVSVKY